jgi:hypothetical protein
MMVNKSKTMHFHFFYIHSLLAIYVTTVEKRLASKYNNMLLALSRGFSASIIRKYASVHMALLPLNVYIILETLT